MKKSLLLIFLLLPLYGFSGVFFNTPLNMQAGDFAQNYAHKKYGIDFEVSSSTYFRATDDRGSFLVNLHPIVDRKVSYCQVDVLFKKPDKFKIGDLVSPKMVDDCGKSMADGKFTDFLEKNIISKYYDPKDISMGAQLQCLVNGKDCVLGKTIDIFNSDQNWNLSTEELLQKYSDNLAVKSVNINIFSQKETPESIAKAMEFAFELNKYLNSLTGMHKVNAIYIYMYDFSKNNFYEKYKSKNQVGIVEGRKFSKEYPRGVKYNVFFTFNDGNPMTKYVPITNSNIFEFVEITNSNGSKRINIKNTKYYQPVKEILSKSEVLNNHKEN